MPTAQRRSRGPSIDGKGIGARLAHRRTTGSEHDDAHTTTPDAGRGGRRRQSSTTRRLSSSWCTSTFGRSSDPDRPTENEGEGEGEGVTWGWMGKGGEGLRGVQLIIGGAADFLMSFLAFHGSTHQRSFPRLLPLAAARSPRACSRAIWMTHRRPWASATNRCGGGR